MKITHTQMAAFCALLASYLSAPVLAQSVRTWVSQNGNDHNDCSVNHPCRTFQRAHDNTDVGGEVDVLDAGEYGHVTITHAITIDGNSLAYFDEIGAISIGPTAGPVTLRNLSITNRTRTDNEIDWAGSELHLENITTGVVIIDPQYQSPVVLLPARHLFMHNTTIRNVPWAVTTFLDINPHPGQILVPVEVTIDHCNFEGPSDFLPSGPTWGVDIEYGRARVTNTVISHFDTGLTVGPTAEVNLADSSISDSTRAVQIHGISTDRGGGIVRMAGNNIHDNTTVFTVLGGGQVVSFGNNRIAGNAGGENPTLTVSMK